MRATAKDLRFHTKEILESVSRGEEVIITFRGKPYARMEAIKSKEEESNELNPLRGIWKNDDDSRDVNVYMDKIRDGRYT